MVAAFHLEIAVDADRRRRTRPSLWAASLWVVGLACVGACQRSAAKQAPAASAKAATDQPAAQPGTTGVGVANQAVGEVQATTGRVPSAQGSISASVGGGVSDHATGAATSGSLETGASASGGSANLGSTPDPQAGTLAAALAVAGSRSKGDDEVLAALDAALAASPSIGRKDKRKLVRLALARGERLHAEPQRAARFFEWAAKADPRDPRAPFALAQQAVIEGDIARTKEFLAQVAARGGKKLIAQVEFDPMWQIVKSEPEVQALLRNAR